MSVFDGVPAVFHWVFGSTVDDGVCVQRPDGASSPRCEVLSGASLLLIRAAGARGETMTKQRNPLRENVDG